MIWLSASGVPVYDDNGRFRGYHGIGRNITERKRAEAALRESEERFRSLTTLSSDFYWETDRRASLQRCSSTAPSISRCIPSRAA